MTAQPEAPAPEAPEAPTGNQPEQPSAPVPAAPQAPAGDTPPADGKVEDLPDWAQRIITDARSDAAKARTNAKQQAADEARQQLAQDIGRTLGLIKDETPADPAALTKQLADQQAQHDTERAAHQTLQREHQVLLAAIKAGADHDALLDSRSFLAKVADLDPAAEDFTTKIEAAVTQAVTDNPKLKAGRAPGASSVDHAGGTGEGAVTAEQFSKMSGAERNELARRDPETYNRLAGRA